MNHDDDLPDLRDASAPRRTDAAFARAVAADVDARRARKGVSVLVPLLAPLGIGVGIFAFVAMHGPSHDLTVIVPTYLPDGAPDAAPDAAAALVADAAPAIDAAVDDEEDGLDGAAVDVDELDDDALVAFADPLPGARDHEPLFAFDGLDGSSDRELDDLEHALDAALAAKL